MVVNLSNARVTHPDGTIFPARFVFHAGKAAAWLEDKQAGTATRILYVTDVRFHKPRTAREPMLIYTDTTDEPLWTIKRDRGSGCGSCGHSVYKNVPITTLLDPDVTSL